MAKSLDVTKNETGKPLELGEVKTGGEELEKVSEFDPRNIDREVFDNEKLVILVYEDQNEGSLGVIRPEVNGIAQPIIRGVQTKVKRKYVEVLARGVATRYTQTQGDPMNPASLKMNPITRQSYPFSVLYDPNPNGRAWLEAIMAERN